MLNRVNGKTYCATEFCLKQLKNNDNLKILTNVKSFYENLQKSIYKSRANYVTDIFSIIKIIKNKNEFEDYIIFFDEIFTILNKSGVLRNDILSFLSQLRKRKILFITTAQEWSEINITFRRYVRFQVVPNMISLPFSKNALIIKDVNDGDLIHWDNDCQDFIAPLIEKQISKGNKEIIDFYDTFETINMTKTAN